MHGRLRCRSYHGCRYNRILRGNSDMSISWITADVASPIDMAAYAAGEYGPAVVLVILAIAVSAALIKKFKKKK